MMMNNIMMRLYRIVCMLAKNDVSHANLEIVGSRDYCQSEVILVEFRMYIILVCNIPININE